MPERARASTALIPQAIARLAQPTTFPIVHCCIPALSPHVPSLPPAPIVYNPQPPKSDPPPLCRLLVPEDVVARYPVEIPRALNAENRVNFRLGVGVPARVRATMGICAMRDHGAITAQSRRKIRDLRCGALRRRKREGP